MQEDEPQIHRSGKVPGAGRWAVKSMSVEAAADKTSGDGMRLSTAEAVDIEGSAAETIGYVRKVLRFTW